MTLCAIIVFVKENTLEKIEIENARKAIKLGLLKMGMRCDFSGFNYLSYAVELVVQDPKLIDNLCSVLYVQVAEHFNVENTGCIERSIRHAIYTLVKTKGFDALNKMFHANLFDNENRPTAGELIRLMAEYYNTELYKENKK